MAKPCLRWVGGKGGLLSQIIPRLPKDFKTYHEPFIGGGALFFKLAPEKATISDINWELINLYHVVRDQTEALIEDMKRHENTEDYYYTMRGLDRDPEYRVQNLKFDSVEKASRFLYLNKTCFNGVYRVNSFGEFNVPFGFRKSVTLVDAVTLHECAFVLKNTDIFLSSFEIMSSVVEAKDFVYLDPPYVPVNDTSFTSYTEDGFGDHQHKTLKVVCDNISAKGAYFMQSNSYTDYVLELYKDYYITEIMAPRYVNSKGDDRGKIKEALITNYPVEEELTIFDFI